MGWRGLTGQRQGNTPHTKNPLLPSGKSFRILTFPESIHNRQAPSSKCELFVCTRVVHGNYTHIHTHIRLRPCGSARYWACLSIAPVSSHLGCTPLLQPESFFAFRSCTGAEKGLGGGNLLTSLLLEDLHWTGRARVSLGEIKATL